MIISILVAAALLLLFWLAWTNYLTAVVLVAGLLPTYLLRFTIAGIPTNVLEVAIGTVLVAGLGQHTVRRSWRQAWQRLPRVVLILICLWLAAAIFSTVTSPHLRTSLGILKGWIVAPLLLGWMVYAGKPLLTSPYQGRCRFDPPDKGDPPPPVGGWRRGFLGSRPSSGNFAQDVINMLLVSGVVVAVIGLAQIGWMGRIRSIYDVPNSLALFLAPLVVLSFWLMIKPPLIPLLRQEGRVRYGAAAVIMFSALLATQSAAGLVAVFTTLVFGVTWGIKGIFKRPQNPSPPPLIRGGVALIPLIRGIRLRQLADGGGGFQTSHLAWLISGVVFMAAASWLVLAQTGRLNYLLNASSNDSYNSIDVRRQLWSVGWKLIQEHPVSGVGLGAFEPAYQNKLHQRFSYFEECLTKQNQTNQEKIEIKKIENSGRTISTFDVLLNILEKENRNKENRKSKIDCVRPIPEFVFRDPHNWIISFWLNTGLLGLVSFAVLNLWVLFYRNTSDVSASWRISNTSDVLFGARLALICILLFGLTDTIYWKNDLSALYWILIALSLEGYTVDGLTVHKMT